MESDNAPVPITAAPKKDQIVEHAGKTFKTVQEGKAYILVPPNARTLLDPQAKGDDGTQVQNVFYNPIQQFNRDLSVLAIKAFGDDVCQRKTLRHAAQREKLGRKQERKRKRTQAKVEGEDEEQQDEGGVKLQKAEDGSPVRTQNGGSTGQAEETVAQGETKGETVFVPDDKDTTAGSREQQNGDSESTPANPVQTKDGLPTHPSAAAAENGLANGHAASTEQVWRPKFRILDALSATGLRALRYASEIPSATAVVANDRDSNAVKNIKLNVEHNKLTESITTNTGDAQAYMYSVAFPPTHSHGPHHVSGKYDVIDLDPYGTAAPFIDASLQALEDGGLLCVTCTDSGVFASCGYSEKTFSLYGGMPIKGLHSHEGGLRLILHSIATSAAKYGISIEPLLSLSIDFYARLFIRVRKSAQEVKFLAGKTMLVYGCDHGCGAWCTQYIGRHARQPGKGEQTNWKFSIAVAPNVDRLCEHCGSKMHLAGPMWGGPLHNPAFLEKMLDDLTQVDQEIYQTKPRIEGMLDTALDELSVNSDSMDFRSTNLSTNTPPDSEAGHTIPQVPPETLDRHPFFFIPSALCKVIKAQAPAENLIKGALRNAGYRVARSHCKPGSIKTDAPWNIVWEVLREWVRQKAPVKEGAVREGSAGWNILRKMRKGDDISDGNAGDAIGVEDAVGGADAAAPSEATTREDTLEGDEGVANGSNAPTKRLEVVFDENLGRDKPGKRLVRYQMNPRDNWGPMSRAKGHG